ncbi:MAG: histidine kinase, partial [Variovorax sp.]
MLPSATALSPDRALLIAKARRDVIERAAGTDVAVPDIEPWITRSWQRCLAAGQRPQQRVAFDAVSTALARRTVDEHRDLALAAQPVLDRLARAIADTRYFAVLTDARGIVVDVRGVPANAERPAIDIARVGVDLSERAVGTTAIGAALAELQPVWLHRGEHFFDDTSLYSCAGAPLFGPDGRCVGMLDLTGVNVVERPELKHLAALSARSIENALVLQQPHALLVRLNWPGYGGHTDAEGLLCLNAEGQVSGSNAVAREMLYPTGTTPATPLHASDLFAMPWTLLWDAAHRTHHPDGAVLEVPLWSGLRLQARPQRMADRAAAPLTSAAQGSPPR